MAEDKATSSSSSSRKTMAPAAKDPAGADERPAEVEGGAGERPAEVEGGAEGESWIDDLSDDELEQLDGEVKRARLRRDRTPREPSFGICEGERDELERTGRTVSPFTGELRGDWSHLRGPRGARR